MKKYIYETETISFNAFMGRIKTDYLEIINERGAEGYKFICFVPREFKVKGVKGLELFFEKEIEA